MFVEEVHVEQSYKKWVHAICICIYLPLLLTITKAKENRREKKNKKGSRAESQEEKKGSKVSVLLHPVVHIRVPCPFLFPHTHTRV